MTASLSSNEVQGLEYLVLGVATCFKRNEEGRLEEILVAEPLPAAELDCLYSAARTSSYQLLYATTYAELVQDGTPVLPADIVPAGTIPANAFVERAQAAVRSYRSKSDFKHLPIGETATPDSQPFALNYNPEPKRILDVVYEPSDADNVKQHSHTHARL
ncbi:hypothetical protein [Synechococcus sp. PCC 7336]|uniref:hypothetical protein n=1 Tax=Synechococcus sp. PCC 7336 TaxID=195250 RepID=UPI00034500DD|nr:hypothetical protein [Synechococcus sp. PCC 7336]